MIDDTVEAVATRPEWLPHSFSPGGDRIASILIRRDEHDRLTFLTDRYFQNRYPVAVHDRKAIEKAAANARQGPLHFIFHTAFCGSTLLTRALTVPGRAMGLKEPIVLNDLALRMGSDDRNFDALLDLTLNLFARPFDEDGAVIVKAPNIANRLIEPVLGSRPESRAILLHSDLQSLMIAVVKEGLERRLWVRQLHAALSEWNASPVAHGPPVQQLTDLQIAGLVWLMQMRQFRDIAARYGDRVLLLNGAGLLEEPRQTLRACTDLFGLGVDDEAIAAIVEGQVFATHSKTVGAGYTIAARNQDYAAAEKAYGLEIGQATAWLDGVTRGFQSEPSMQADRAVR